MTRRMTLSGLVAALAIPVLLAACSSGSGGATALPTIPPSTPAASTDASPTADPMAHPTYPPGCPTAQPAALPAGETRTVTITTDQGDIVIKVEADLSPIAAGNFVALAECGYYDNVVFHRIVPEFVIQAGDGSFGRAPNVFPGSVGGGGPDYTIKDEPVTADYVRGAVAMAKTEAPDSASSQFFIVLADLPTLPKSYQVFGNVTSGMETVDAIAAMPNDGSQMSLAVDPVPMTKVTVANP
ncbi:MAG TPA: peptidylprolyl isomerase [Candidatus Limnocylindrales bacterium]|nr:peptidylprolyl isomerase [Candidatus Limnocylindrales bacterium]